MIGVRGGGGGGEPPFKNAVRARRMEISCQLKLIRNERVPNHKNRGTQFFAIWSEKYQICWAPAPSELSADPGRAGLSSADNGRARPNSAEAGRVRILRISTAGRARPRSTELGQQSQSFVFSWFFNESPASPGPKNHFLRSRAGQSFQSLIKILALKIAI